MSYIFRVCVRSLTYPPCNAQARIVICVLSASTIFFFSHYLLCDRIFEGKNWLNTKCVFCFPLKLLSETFLILRSERDFIINVNCYCCQILIKLEIYRQIFENYSCNKFYQNLSSGIRFVSCERIGRWTGMTKLTVVFRKFAKASKTGVRRCNSVFMFIYKCCVYYNVCNVYFKKKEIENNYK